MPSNQDSAHKAQQQQQQQQHHHHQRDSFPDLQYYEISQSDGSIPDSLQQSNTESGSSPRPNPPTTAAPHLHPINLCTSSAVQLQDILPGTVFTDPSLGGHLHYHIYPSRRTLNCLEAGQGLPGSACRSHSRLEQVHHHDHHQHYQRHNQHRIIMRPPTSLDELAKERDRANQSNFENFTRYPPLAHERSEKLKNMSMVDLNSDSQSELRGMKSKCQCHEIQQRQQALRLKRDSEARDGGIGSSGPNAGGRDRQPPALPPRPPPRPTDRRYEMSVDASDRRHAGDGGGGGCCRKYVVLCCLCGGLSAAVGGLFLAVHAVLSAHTASLALFETVPSYIPGTMLIFMGLFTMLLARRKHRYGFLMKVCGSVSVVCALVCVLVTVTTTVVHMSRLQGLRECVYTARAKSCTCYGAPQSRASDPGVLFEGTPHCEAVHGALYACLRALFGVSVAGILACIFSCMLVYQLLSHEKKKMYWEQLELRCRSLYGQGAAGAGLVGARPAGTCGCCNDCGGIGPWWAQSPGNLYTPNPDLAPPRRWRLPWSRSRGPAPTADASYGFHGQAAAGHAGVPSGATTAVGPHHQPEGLLDGGVGGMVPYSILGAQYSAGAYSALQPTGHEDPYSQTGGAGPYSVLEAAVPLWGPPPPYSDPNSPARRPMLAFPSVDSRARMTKRMDSFPMREVTYSRSPDIKRPSGNYENAEQVSNDTDTETTVGNGENRATRSSKHKKLLKGVENAAFQQQESSTTPKQSESELYFGDVSSCCGPESSLYDVATEKDGKLESCQTEAGTSSYLPSQFSKRPSSRRSRRQQQTDRQQTASPRHHDSEMTDLPSNSSFSSNGEDPATGNPTGASHSRHAAEVEYEVIRQRHYNFEGPGASYEDKQRREEREEELATESRAGSDEGAYGSSGETEPPKEAEKEFKDYRAGFSEVVKPVKV